MVDVIHYFHRRQQGLRNINSKVGQRNVKLDFLIERLTCKKSDSLIIGCDDHSSPPFACKFRKDSSGSIPILATVTERGDVLLLNADASNESILLHSWSAHENAIFDVCWHPFEPKLFTASGDNTVVLWNSLGDEIRMFCGHSGSVKCVDVCPFQPSIFASGARDGKIFIWDARVNKDPASPEITITDAHTPNWGQENDFKKKQNNQYRSVTSIAFQDEYLLASGGVGDQAIKFWDLRKTYIAKPKKGKMPIPKYSLQYHGDGCTHMIFDSTYKKLFACCTNSNIYQYDCHKYNIHHVAAYNGHKVNTYFTKMSLSCDDQFLMSGSSDSCAYIWKVGCGSVPVARLEGHEEEVTGTTWHPRNMLKLATCGDDGQILVWNVSDEHNSQLDKDVYLGFAKPVSSESTVQTNSDNIGIDKARKSSPLHSSMQPSNTMSIKQFFSKASRSTHNVTISTTETALHSANEAPSMVSNKTDNFMPNNYSRPVLSATMLCNNEENIRVSGTSPVSSKDEDQNSRKRELSYEASGKASSISSTPQRKTLCKELTSTPRSVKKLHKRTTRLNSRHSPGSTDKKLVSQNRSIRSYFHGSP